jgi:hypothetical protein
MQPVYVAVDDIEFGGPVSDVVQQHRLRCNGINVRTGQAQGARPDGNKTTSSGRISTREERDFVAEPNELLGQPRNDTLGTAIELRRNAFSKRRNLCDTHKFYQSPGSYAGISRPTEFAPRLLTSPSLHSARFNDRDRQ